MSPRSRIEMARRVTQLVVVAFVIALTLALPTHRASARVTSASASPQTIVSLTFDDGRATQYLARPILASHGMHATFYVNSPFLGSNSFYMTWSQVQGLYSDGNEIGGHDAYHANLVQVDSTEAQRQICYDRVNLLNHGFQPTDFAYPYGAYNASVQSLAQTCGYNSARTTDSLSLPAVALPPANPYAIQSLDGSGSNALTTLESAVTAAVQNGGGWVPVVFHDICDGCSSIAISQANFTAFLDWLQQQTPNGVVVQTVAQVIGGPLQAPVAGPSLPAAPNAANTLHNASLEFDTNADQGPDCFAFDDFGSNNFTWTRTTAAHTGTYAERLDVSNWSSGDNKLDIQQDLGTCTPTVTPGHQYRITEWYISSVPVSFTVFSRRTDWSFPYWINSPDFPATSTWSQASWVTPTIPSNVNGLNFGLTLDTNGSLTVDDFAITDAAATGSDTTAPTVSLTAPSGGTVSGMVTISATASDNVAVDHVDFLVDGSVVGTAVTGYSYGWNSRTVPNGNHTISARAVDTSSNATTSATTTVFVSNQSTNLLQNPSLETGSGSTPTCWLLGGYGTNTFTWARTSDAHSGSFAENLSISSYTSGDRKLVGSQDSGACAPAAIPGHAYSVTAWYKGSVRPIFFAYYRNSSGSWVFLTNSAKLPLSSAWTQGSWSTPAIPAGATNLSVGLGTDAVGSLTMDDLTLVDNAPPPDTTAPTTTITCTTGTGDDSEGTCASFYNAPVQITLTAVDNPGGSGVASIRYTTDGTDPSLTNGKVYTGPFTTTTAVKYRAYDNAGNAEAVHTQPISIDTQPPATSISCNALPCTNGFYGTGVSISLAATDTGGSGVAATYYTTDGTDPSSSNGTVYIGAFSLTSSATVKFRSYDNAGNAEAVNTKAIQIDTVAPTTSIACNGASCATGYYNSSVQVSLSAVDSGGSGVASIRYTTDGTSPTLTNGTVYSTAFSLSSTATVKYRAWDNAGNAEAVNSQSIVIDTVAPISAIACNGAPCSTTAYSGAVTVTLSASDNPGGSGVGSIIYTTDGTAPSPTNGTAYQSALSITATTTIEYRAYDVAGNAEPINTQTITIATAPTVTLTSPAAGATLTGSVTLAATATGMTVDHIAFAVDGTVVATDTAAPYSVTWDSTTVTNGSHTLVARAFDPSGAEVDSPPVTVTVSNAGPAVAITSPAGGATVNGTVTLSANASGMTVDHIDFAVDGTVVATDSSAPYSATWDSTTVANGSHALVARAFDPSGTEVDSTPVTVTVSNAAPPDTTPPTSSISCNGGACASGYYSAAVSVTLNATDNPGGSGVASIRYTTDGTTPTLANGTVYGGAFSLSVTKTVKYRAWDNAGNVESVKSQLIQIDTTAPTSTISCNSSSCASTYYTNAVSVTLSAADTGGSGVASIIYTTDGSDPSTTNGSTYTGALSLTGTTTMKYRAFDNAGNAEPVNSALIHVDITPPSATIACNGNACTSGYYQAGVSVSLSATDADSGVASIRYTTNGTDPTLTNGTVYNAPFSPGATTTIKYRAWDNVGNATPVQTQLVQVDSSPPTASLTSPTAGATLGGTVTLSASASDNVAVDHVDFLVDGTVVATSTAAPYSVSWNSQSVSDGKHTITARAADSAGNTTTSSAVTVTVTNQNLLQNPSLEAASGSTPACWLFGGSGTNTYTWTRTSDAHSGSFAENITVSSYTSGDRKLVNTQDSGACAPAVTAGRTYTVTAWYKGSDQPYFFAYYRNAAGSWVFWTNSAKLPLSSAWAQATWTTPAVPSGATNVSVGLGVDAVGSLTMDDFGLFLAG
jgi:peptidoglycan/xylan/chitin deacetylase (PgdA/CDA1 family)